MTKSRLNSRIIPTLNEKRYYTLKLLEASVMGGSKVAINTVKDKNISELSAEDFIYNNDNINTYIIFDERPKVNLLKTLGWFREDGTAPILAYIPTHLIYKESNSLDDLKEIFTEDNKLNPFRLSKGTKINLNYPLESINILDEYFIADSEKDEFIFRQEGEDLYFIHYLLGDTEIDEEDLNWNPITKELTYLGEESFYLDSLKVKVNDILEDTTLIPVGNSLLNLLTVREYKYEVENYDVLTGEHLKALVKEGKSYPYTLKDLKIIRGTLIDIEYDFLPNLTSGDPDPLGVTNRFFVADSKVDLVSLNYIVNLVPYRYNMVKPEYEPFYDKYSMILKDNLTNENELDIKPFTITKGTAILFKDINTTQNENINLNNVFIQTGTTLVFNYIDNQITIKDSGSPIISSTAVDSEEVYWNPVKGLLIYKGDRTFEIEGLENITKGNVITTLFKIAQQKEKDKNTEYIRFDTDKYGI